MYIQVQKKLIELLEKADENTGLICGSVFAYMNGENQLENSDYSWGDFIQEIIADNKFITDTDNMQLLVKLK